MRFRLRTLFALLTIIACGLGTGVWAWQPAVYVPTNETDVGMVKRGARGKTTFEVVNRGWQPIELSLVYTTNGAQCEPSDTLIPEGESRRVTIEWTAIVVSGAASHSLSSEPIARVRMHTSDARRPSIDFRIVGRVIE